MSIARATVQQITALNDLGLVYESNLGLGRRPPRPFLGGAVSGYHAAPQVGDQVATLFDGERVPVAVVPTTARPQTMLALLPGESVQLAADGRSFGFLKASGDTTIFTNAAGTLLITINHTTSNIQITTPGQVNVTATGGMFVNAVRVGG